MDESSIKPIGNIHEARTSSDNESRCPFCEAGVPTKHIGIVGVGSSPFQKILMAEMEKLAGTETYQSSTTEGSTNNIEANKTLGGR